MAIIDITYLLLFISACLSLYCGYFRTKHSTVSVLHSSGNFTETTEEKGKGRKKGGTGEEELRLLADGCRGEAEVFPRGLYLGVYMCTRGRGGWVRAGALPVCGGYVRHEIDGHANQTMDLLQTHMLCSRFPSEVNKSPLLSLCRSAAVPLL